MVKKMIRLNEVINVTSLSCSVIYRMMEADEFPKNVSIGKRAMAWEESAVCQWIDMVLAGGLNEYSRTSGFHLKRNGATPAQCV
ncbi:AlpA family phage regulatory protein [Vibrio splendidus]|uniref:AlpA family phage regulatory protein n=1 Tax=Vibrio splendidus TaxID=29497 RepID=UPI00223597B6|nr:AlpA family phage regulatory protein [Vibrio splendidus]MCW4438868.1 AlpA family phage regulatory protein [Vibrio splendidus]